MKNGRLKKVTAGLLACTMIASMGSGVALAEESTETTLKM